MRLIIKEIFVYILITGKISEESLNYIITPKNNATNGVLDLLLITTEMAAQMNITAAKVMGGRNRNITRRIINWIPVNTEINVIKFIVPIIILKKIADNLYSSGLKFSQRLDSWISPQTTTCLSWEIWHKTKTSWVALNRHLFLELRLIYLSKVKLIKIQQIAIKTQIKVKNH